MMPPEMLRIGRCHFPVVQLLMLKDSLYFEDAGLLFSGDTLFAGSVGRTDLKGGSLDRLIHSIGAQLLDLADDISRVLFLLQSS